MTQECDEEGITVTKKMDIKDSHFMYTQETEKSQKVLDYDYKWCTGCGLCVSLCPTRALELGPMHEIATGMDAPPVMMDIDKCSFCGMCANFCPIHAITIGSGGELPEKESFPEYDSYVKVNEKCLPCILCEAACPKEAIKVEFTFPKKEQIAPIKIDSVGQIEIDHDKCNFCGICARFCDAFILVEREPTPTDPRPFEQIMVNEDKCDYCVLCQDMCPEDAISVKGDLLCNAPAVEGNLTIDCEKCTMCTWCKAVCPYDAVAIKKPFEGEISLVEGNIDKCDPQGCHGCFNVCPSHLWYVPTDRKIAIVEDYCTYCGACANACHLDVVRVSRSKVNHTDIPDSPWASQWRDALESLLTAKRHYPDTSHALIVGEELPKEYVEFELPEMDESLKKVVREQIQKVMPSLKSVKIRKMWESEPPEGIKESK